MVRWRRFSFVVGIGLAIGCGGPPPAREVSNPDLSGKIPAIKDSVERHDMESVHQLVRDLDSDDPAVRFYAIQGLQRLTGETFGYQYFADEQARKPALDRWKAWLSSQQAAKKQ